MWGNWRALSPQEREWKWLNGRLCPVLSRNVWHLEQQRDVSACTLRNDSNDTKLKAVGPSFMPSRVLRAMKTWSLTLVCDLVEGHSGSKCCKRVPHKLSNTLSKSRSAKHLFSICFNVLPFHLHKGLQTLAPDKIVWESWTLDWKKSSGWVRVLIFQIPDLGPF